MEKTTVYLPVELKRALRQAAERRHTSEANLIREGVAMVTREDSPPEPRLPLFASDDPTLAESVDEALHGFGEK
jgi:hypothetical protein